MRLVGACLASMCVALAATVVVAPAHADEPLAGQPLQTLSRAQPFCTDKAQLHAKVLANLSHVTYPQGYFASCVMVPDNVRVEVIEDLAPTSRYMHIVRARAYLLFGPLDAYTYSVGLYAPIRGYEVPPPVAYR